MLPKDINNITEPVYKRLHGEIEDAIENIPVLFDVIDLFDVKVAARATTLQDVFDKFNELNLEYGTRYFIRQFKYGEYQGGYISTQNMYDCILEINKVNYGSITYTLNIYPLYFGAKSGAGTIQIVKFYADAYPDFTKDLTYYSRYLVILGETNKHSTGVDDAKTYVLKYINGSTRFIEDTGNGTKLYLHTINIAFSTPIVIHCVSLDSTQAVDFDSLKSVVNTSLKNYGSDDGTLPLNREYRVSSSYDPNVGVIKVVTKFSTSYSQQSGLKPVNLYWDNTTYNNEAITDTVTEL